MKHRAPEKNYGIARDYEDRKPGRKFSVMRIYLAPITDAQRNNSAEEKSLVGDRIENCAERAPLIVAARHIAVEPVTNGRQQKNRDRREAHPILGMTFLDAFAVIDRERHEDRDHQDPNYGDLVGSRHERASRS